MVIRVLEPSSQLVPIGSVGCDTPRVKSRDQKAFVDAIGVIIHGHYDGVNESRNINSAIDSHGTLNRNKDTLEKDEEDECLKKAHFFGLEKWKEMLSESRDLNDEGYWQIRTLFMLFTGKSTGDG
ncbi:hypothetical protein BGX34_000066 [Mortierella sp. NVP85]|nr:hypothetical protein BGX34_000066 [Mortierella sp. NVP85]